MKHGFFQVLGLPSWLGFALWLGVVPPAVSGGDKEAISSFGPESLRRDVDRLAGTLALRNHAHPEVLAQAARYIEERFRLAGGRVEVATYPVDGTDYRNVIARFGPADGPPVVIGAHYDAAEPTPGADDNASGVAGLLALADVFRTRQPSIPVELVAYCLEEPPYFGTEAMGSRHHARSLRTAGRLPRLVMVLEMIGYFTDEPGSQRYPVGALGWIYPDRGNFIGVVGNLASSREVRLVKRAMAEAGTVPVESIAAPESLPGVNLSDHASYWREDMAAVMVTDTAFYRNPHYHTPSDRPDTLDYRRMAAVVGAIHYVIQYLEKSQPP